MTRSPTGGLFLDAPPDPLPAFKLLFEMHKEKEDRAREREKDKLAQDRELAKELMAAGVDYPDYRGELTSRAMQLYGQDPLPALPEPKPFPPIPGMNFPEAVPHPRPFMTAEEKRRTEDEARRRWERALDEGRRVAQEVQRQEEKKAELARSVAQEKTRQEEKKAELARSVAQEKTRQEEKKAELARSVAQEKTRQEGLEETRQFQIQTRVDADIRQKWNDHLKSPEYKAWSKQTRDTPWRPWNPWNLQEDDPVYAEAEAKYRADLEKKWRKELELKYDPAARRRRDEFLKGTKAGL